MPVAVPKRSHTKKTVPLTAQQVAEAEAALAAKRAEESKAQAEPDPGEITVSIKGWRRDFSITISSED